MDIKESIALLILRRDKDGIPAKVATIEYDPNRTAHIALLNYADGEKRYIIAPQSDYKWEIPLFRSDARYCYGNALPLKYSGRYHHPQYRVKPGKGGQLVRSAGASAQLMAKEGEYGHVVRLR